MSTLINGILAAEELLASRVAAFAKTYPRQITAAITTVLLCAGGGAFAVASLPDPASLPVKQVFEAVAPLPVAAQSNALDSHQFTLFRSDQSRAGDTAEALLGRLGVTDPVAAAFVRANSQARAALFDRVSRLVDAEVGQDDRLHKLTARWIPDGKGEFKRFVVERRAEGFATRFEPETLTPGMRLITGQVRTNLFAATDAAGLPDAVSSQLADIFTGEVDFRKMRRGDRFTVLYETFEADGRVLRTGRVLAAEFENEGKQSQALWFQEPGQEGAYYRPNGNSLRQTYLDSPVQFTRMSSGFAMRQHPIFNDWRQHNGVDFSAPTGTPVRTVGDGKVDFAGQQSGYGNIVIIGHRNGQQTVYAHLSRMDVAEGDSVAQGQTIGAVGMTGWATGPHLHFEFRVNGEYQDPSTIAQQAGGAPISTAARPAFDRVARSMRTELAVASTLQVQASAE